MLSLFEVLGYPKNKPISKKFAGVSSLDSKKRNVPTILNKTEQTQHVMNRSALVKPTLPIKRNSFLWGTRKMV